MELVGSLDWIPCYQSTWEQVVAIGLIEPLEITWVLYLLASAKIERKFQFVTTDLLIGPVNTGQIIRKQFHTVDSFPDGSWLADASLPPSCCFSMSLRRLQVDREREILIELTVLERQRQRGKRDGSVTHNGILEETWQLFLLLYFPPQLNLESKRIVHRFISILFPVTGRSS